MVTERKVRFHIIKNFVVVRGIFLISSTVNGAPVPSERCFTDLSSIASY